MSRALRMWPLLTATQRYEKLVSTRNRGHGQYIEAPILAYLIETPQGRILYDAGCDYRKIATPEMRTRYFADEVANSDGWRLQDREYTVSAGVHAVASPGHTAGHLSLFVELPHGKPVILCGDAADLRENLRDEIAPGLCWQDDESLAIASIRKLNALAAREKADLWPNHDFDAYRAWPQFPAWRS